jgi:hypothetical protein
MYRVSSQSEERGAPGAGRTYTGSEKPDGTGLVVSLAMGRSCGTLDLA